MTTRNPERLLLLATFGMGLYFVLGMPVFSQESYYWCYAQHPDLSYHDHPPMVAWLIWLGTSVFGDGRVGIRLGTLLIGWAAIYAGYRLLHAFDASASARRTWLVLGAIVPSLAAIRFLTNPDPGLCGFWMLTLLALWKARDGALGWWALAGFFAGCALLSKYTAIFLAVGGVLVLLADPKMRRQLFRPGPWLGVVVAALVFLPVLIWNVSNDFESFRFQTEGRLTHASFGLHWFLQFVGGQLLVLNPVVSIGLAAATVWLLGRAAKRDPRAIWLLAFSLPMAGFLLFSSLFVQVKINWLIPTAQPLLLGLAMWWGDGGFRERHPVAASRSTRIALGFGLLPLFGPLIVFFPQGRGSTWTGWDEIARRAESWEERIDSEDQVEGNMFFFAGDYRDAAQLTRHLELVVSHSVPGEVVEPTLAQNVFGLSALQFDHWEDPRTRIGQNAIFVLPRPHQRQSLLERVAPHFDKLERVEHVSVQRMGIGVLDADVFVCRGYRGPDA